MPQEQQSNPQDTEKQLIAFLMDLEARVQALEDKAGLSPTEDSVQ